MNPDDVARALYTNADADRFFLIGDGVFLPEGPLYLRSMQGGLRAVDPITAKVYEIRGNHARRLMKGAITGILGDATRAVSQLGILLATFGKAAEQPVMVLNEPRRRAERAQRVADLLGIELEEAEDRELVRNRLAELLVEMETELRHRDVLSKDQDARAFREHFQKILTLAAEEVAAEHDPFAGTMPLALREAFQSHDIQESMREVSVMLHSLREGVESMNDLDE